MRTAVTDTSRDAFRAIRLDGTLARCYADIMAVIKPTRDYSLSEIAKLTGIEKSSVSARVNALKSAPMCLLEEAPERRCTITGKRVTPVRLPRVQFELFN